MGDLRHLWSWGVPSESKHTSNSYKETSSFAGLTALEGTPDTFTSFQQVYLWKGKLCGGG